MSKNSMIIVAVIVVLIGGALFYLNNNTTPTGILSEGNVLIGISDATNLIQGVSAVMVTVSKVEVQGATEEWMTVSSTSKQYDLLQLKQTGAVALLADANLSAGTYNQIRLTISKVEVTANGVTKEAKLPSGMLKIVGRIVVEAGKTATAVLDFKADKSLHITGNGTFIMAPVVNFKSKRGASVEKRKDNTLKIDGGDDEDDVNVGMDERGDTKKDFELDTNAKIDIDSENIIHVNGKQEGDDKGSEDSHSNSNEQSQSSVRLNLASQNNSGIAGFAMLESADGKVKVTLKLAGVPTGIVGALGISLGATHPAHVHQGSCASIGAVKYPLSSTVDGASKTTINLSLAELKSQLPLAINVHKSSDEIGVYVACADLKF